MSSRMHGSEVRLAELAVIALGDASRQRVLIGGLGCGYTLAAALAMLGPHARVTVDEISPAVIQWNVGILAPLAGRPLDDRRVQLRELDVIDHLKHTDEEFDLILLDVDNGPSALSQARNAWLYAGEGLARLARALSPGGVLGVWSAGPDPRFVKRLSRAGLRVTEHRVPAGGGRGKRCIIWIARR